MSLSINSFPRKYVNDSASLVSNWNSVHHPIKFGLIRKDLAVTSVSEQGGYVRINFSVAPYILNGESIYLSSGVYAGVYTVTAFSNDYNYIIINKTYTSSSVGGYINRLSGRENYYVSTRVYLVNEFNQYVLIGTSVNKPFSDGNVVVDVSAFLKSAIDFNETFEFDVLNKKDTTLSGRFNISYSENWDGSEGEFSTPDTQNVFYFTNSVKQIQDRYGANMGEYVPFATVTTTKFLTSFSRPTYFEGFPFALSFIFSDKIYARRINKVEETKNVNNSVIDSIESELDNSEALFVNRLMLDESYTDEIKSIDVWLEDDSLLCLMYVDEDYVDDDYVEERCDLPVIDMEVTDAENP